MRAILLLFGCLLSLLLSAQNQSVKEQLYGPVWVENHTPIAWSFRDSGIFSAFFLQKAKGGFAFTAKGGTFQLSDSAHKLYMSFDSTFTVYAKDSFLIGKDIGIQVWDILSLTSTKMVISRPPVWDFEKRRKVNETGHIIVTLERQKSKKRKT